VTILNPDGGTFILNIQNPLDNSMWTSKPLSTNASADTFAWIVSGYYSKTWGASISATRYMYDINDSLTTLDTESVKTIF